MINTKNLTNAIESAAGCITRNDTIGALRIYQDILHSFPGNADAYAGIGYARALRQEFAEAIKSYINALRLRRQDEWMLDLAHVYINCRETIAAGRAGAATRAGRGCREALASGPRFCRCTPGQNPD